MHKHLPALRLISRIHMAFLAVVTMALPLIADTVYSYQGNPYNQFSGLTCPPVCGISATLDLSAPIGANKGTPFLPYSITPLSFTVTDGSNTITQSNDLSAVFGFVTDSSGQIALWNFSVAYLANGIQVDISSLNRGSGASTTHDETFAVISYAENSQDPGAWTATTSGVPEPSSILLFSIACAVLLAFSCTSGLIRRRAAISRGVCGQWPVLSTIVTFSKQSHLVLRDY